MVGPFTPNAGFTVPNTGDLPGTWGDDAINPDFVAIDGMLSGVQTINVTGGSITLTAPSGFTPTPGAGPVQSQNRVLKFTGTLASNQNVGFPIPGSYLIDNKTLPGAFSLFLFADPAADLVCAPPGSTFEIYSDGDNVRFVGLGKTGEMELWAGRSTMPSWATQSLPRPYLLCDGSTANIADYPVLAAILGTTFGGNGLTTFGLPDLRGRVPLAYDGTGSRITVAGCGINGQTLGAAGGVDSIMLAANQIPSLTSVNASQAITVVSTISTIGINALASSRPVGGGFQSVYDNNGPTGSVTSTGNNSISVTYTNASQQVVNNVQPAQVVGIWVIKT